jgi:hypothetical protein
MASWKSRTKIIATPHVIVCLSPISPLVLPLNLTYTLLIHLVLFSVNLTYRVSLHSILQNFMSIFCCLAHSKKSVQVWHPVWHFVSSFASHSEELLVPCLVLKVQDNPLLADCSCLFNMLTATVHIWRLSPPPPSPPTKGYPMPLLQGPT